MNLLSITQLAINDQVATSTGINLLFITHGYKTLSLDYNITATTGTGNRGVRTPADIRNEITRKLQEASDFTQAVIAYAQDIQ